MHLVFDARIIELEQTGLARYTTAVLKHLLLSNTDAWDFITILVTEKGKVDFYKKLELSPPRIPVAHSLKLVNVRPISLSQHFKLRPFLKKINFDYYFYPHFDVPLFVGGQNKIFVIHDVIPLKVDGYVQTKAFFKKFYMKTMIRIGLLTCHRCITVSENTRSDILRLTNGLFRQKIRTVYEGCDFSDFAVPQSSKPVTKYILYVGDKRPHKNIANTIQVFQSFKQLDDSDWKLILVGNQKYYSSVDKGLASSHCVEDLGIVSDERLYELYSNCQALILLSLYEGFGLPVVEAGGMGKKVIISSHASLPEIAPDWSLILDLSDNLETQGVKLKNYLSSHIQIDSNAYRKKFNWSNVCEKIFERLA